MPEELAIELRRPFVHVYVTHETADDEDDRIETPDRWPFLGIPGAEIVRDKWPCDDRRNDRAPCSVEQGDDERADDVVRDGIERYRPIVVRDAPREMPRARYGAHQRPAQRLPYLAERSRTKRQKLDERECRKE